MTYRSPGVYVEEISVFPPSVAEVPTAIPAFIGYTEKARFKGKDLAGKAVEVTSLIEFEERFGKGPAVQVDEVVLTEANNVSSVETTSNFYMYDSLRLYFTNGGGRCYIVSVGSYKDDIQKSAIEGGLAVVAKEDEPTLLLFPDAPLLSGNQLYELQQAALRQSADLGDRFAIMDLIETEGVDAKESYKTFRDNIGINNLKYGAAYTPYLKAGLPKEVRYRQLQGKLKKYGAVIDIASLTEETEVKDTITGLKSIIADAATFQSAIDGLKGASASLTEAYQVVLNAFKNEINDPAATDTTIRSAFKALCTFCYDLLDEVVDDTAKAGALTGTGPDSLAAAISQRITTEIDAVAGKINSYVHNANAAVGGTALNQMYTTYTWDAAEWQAGRFDAAGITEDNTIYTGADNKAKMIAAEPAVSGIAKQLIGAVGDLQMAAENLELAREALLTQQMPTYKNIVTAVKENLTVVPPGGAIAGIYCMVDNNRGVWKAPANVSLSGVAGLTERIDNTVQDGLNVDVNAGKSINAIRAFAGRGILVWGARTLAGNDNEWRYVPVRRFFNMVEESVKKSTYWAVFEPNDANLWTKLKAMIDNYLTLKWREGALAGSKPEEAFFVHVGLGKTMTAQDILEGRLIVDIGMAVVRPAEFIILRFMHKMQES